MVFQILYWVVCDTRFDILRGEAALVQRVVGGCMQYLVVERRGRFYGGVGGRRDRRLPLSSFKWSGYVTLNAVESDRFFALKPCSLTNESFFPFFSDLWSPDSGQFLVVARPGTFWLCLAPISHACDNYRIDRGFGGGCCFPLLLAAKEGKRFFPENTCRWMARLIDWLNGPLIDWTVLWLIDWLFDGRKDRWTEWLIDWFLPWSLLLAYLVRLCCFPLQILSCLLRFKKRTCDFVAQNFRTAHGETAEAEIPMTGRRVPPDRTGPPHAHHPNETTSLMPAPSHGENADPRWIVVIFLS